VMSPARGTIRIGSTIVQTIRVQYCLRFKQSAGVWLLVTALVVPVIAAQARPRVKKHLRCLDALLLTIDPVLQEDL